MKTKKQTFLQGALILVAANLIVKLIGALFKIPLTYTIGKQGMGFFNKSYNIYAALFVIATAGIPVAVSKMVSESMAKNNLKEAKRIFNLALAILCIFGVLGSAFFYFGADWIAKMVGDVESAEGIMAIAPAIFFVSIVSAFRGFFQGNQNMIPTAISEVIESVGKLSIGLILAMLLLDRGIKAAATGAILGVTVGTFLACVCMIVIYLKHQKSFKIQANREIPCRSRSQLVKIMLAIAIPITIGASVSSLTSIIDTVMISGRLQEIGYSIEQAREMFGAYTGYAVTMFNMPLTLITALSMSVVPAIAGAVVSGRRDTAKRNTVSALRIAMLFSIPSAVGLSVLAGPILEFLFKDTYAKFMLSILAYGVIFVSVVSVSTAILQAAGKVYIPVLNMLIGGIAKITINHTLVGMPDININGAPIGTVVCYAIIAVLNAVAVSRVLEVKYDFAGTFIKPSISAAAMGASAILVYTQVSKIISSNSICMLLSIVIGVIIYGGVLIALGGLNRDDIKMMPKGEKIVKILDKLKIV